MQLTITGPYTAKDQAKAAHANKFIGRGSSRSSTAQYARDYGQYANCGIYGNADSVFISAEGARSSRLDPDFAEIDKAIAAEAMFITDNATNRNRAYNVGERQVAAYLTQHKYKPTELPGYALWHPLT